MSEKLQIGIVTRPHGVRGLVRVRASEQLLGLPRVWLRGREVRLVRVQPEREEFLVELEGMHDRDAAEALRGAALEVERDALPPPDDDELYVADLIGCRVVDARGAELGEVVETFDSGAHEVLVVRGSRESGAREFMLPLVDAIVTHVDLDARRITCDPPPGLIDLDEAEEG
jgi:16S rRNA processing protein RimM